ncbi:MAG TPA: ABC transporter permease [Pirellulales bacterium]|jgi:putative ABC transport system permease protein|nr:ABC transporter permease [Pirellulales bacterium]
MKFVFLILKNLRRNLLRTVLTALGTVVLVFVVTLVWSVLSFLDDVTSEKSTNLKAIVTERWQIPSQMPFAYAATLADGAARKSGDVHPIDSMTWQFFGGTLDPKSRTRENLVFAIAMQPRKMITMMDELDRLTGDDAAEMERILRLMESNRRGIVIGRERLAAIDKRVGERIVLHGLNYKDINLEFDIVGTFSVPRYDQTAVMNREYLNEALDEYARTHRGEKHPMVQKTLNLVWVRVPDQQSYSRVAEQIMSSPYYSMPAVKVETESSGVSAFLESYRDLIWGMRWLLSPAILVTLSLIISNAISISVRERRLEMAVLKVLGFLPRHIMLLVLGEAVLVGTLAGLASATGTYYVVNDCLGGLKFPIAFFPAFFIPRAAIGWGLTIGLTTSLLGSIVPAWGARTVRVSDVFAKVA